MSYEQACSALGEGGGDFGSALEYKSFTALAKHMNNHQDAHADVAEQDMLDMGLAQCPCCHMLLPFIGGGNSGWMAHMRSTVKTSTPHAEYAGAQSHGWEAASLADMRRRVTLGSAADYYMRVGSTKSGAAPRPDEVARKEVQWQDAIARRQQRELQEAARRAREAAHDPGARATLLGGAHATTVGQPKHRRPPVSLDMQWDWLDKIESKAVHELDTLVSRTCLPEMRAEYLAMLHFGFEHAAKHMGGPKEAWGYKFVVLAKAVTIGRLKQEAPRSIKEQRGRIRLVLSGHLEKLFKELCDEAKAHAAEAAEAAGAARVARGEAAAAEQTSAAHEERRVRDEAVAAMAVARPTGGIPVTEAEHKCYYPPTLEAGDVVRLTGVSAVNEQRGSDGFIYEGGVAEWRPGGRPGPLLRAAHLEDAEATIDHWVAERGRWAVRVMGTELSSLLLVAEAQLAFVKAGGRRLRRRRQPPRRRPSRRRRRTRWTSRRS